MGLVIQPGRMALELRPPLDMDKGQVVRRVVRPPYQAACFLGDDMGDVAAFTALAELASTGVRVLRVAVVDDESPPEVPGAADIAVAGPEAALELLRRLASSVPEPGR